MNVVGDGRAGYQGLEQAGPLGFVRHRNERADPQLLAETSSRASIRLTPVC